MYFLSSSGSIAGAAVSHELDRPLDLVHFATAEAFAIRVREPAPVGIEELLRVLFERGHVPS